MTPNAQQGSESPARVGRESEALRSQLEEERKRVAQVQRELEEQRSQLLTTSWSHRFGASVQTLCSVPVSALQAALPACCCFHWTTSGAGF